MGRFIVKTILLQKLDIDFNVKFKSEWFYMFTGRITLFRDYAGLKHDHIMLTTAQILCEINKNAVLYSGIIQDYRAKGNKLEYIVLKNVERKFSTDPIKAGDEDIRYFGDKKKIKGDYVLILGDQIKNINIHYTGLDNSEFRDMVRDAKSA